MEQEDEQLARNSGVGKKLLDANSRLIQSSKSKNEHSAESEYIEGTTARQ